MNHRLNEYLDDLESRLRFLPEADRQQEINEIRPHIQSLIAACREGQTEDAATHAALRQFGTARAVSSRALRVERRRQLIQVAETVGFCAAFDVAYNALEQGVLRMWQVIAPLPETLSDQLGPTPPFYWAVGFAAFAILFWRLGWRGIVQKALHNNSPVSAALRLLFWVNLVLIAWCFFSTYYFRAFPANHLRDGDIAVSLGFLFGWCGLGVFFVGRSSTCRGSVAGSVGVAAALIPLAGLLAVTVSYVPSFAAFLKDWPGYLMGAACWIVPGTIFVLWVLLVVQMGEKSRRRLPNHAKQTA